LATHKSAEKRNRQSERRRKRNASIKSHVKTRIKSVNTAVEAKNLPESEEKLAVAVKVVAKAASKGILHKNNAGRKISRLVKKVNALKASEAV
jgi:small subunit ribosomal protein S20